MLFLVEKFVQNLSMKIGAKSFRPKGSSVKSIPGQNPDRDDEPDLEEPACNAANHADGVGPAKKKMVAVPWRRGLVVSSPLTTEETGVIGHGKGW
jgi:hypothetical protein